MAELVGSLTAVLLADTKDFSAKMGEAKAEMDDVAGKGSSAFGKLASVGKAALLGIGAVVIGVGVESVKLASTFQESMAQVQAAAGITAKQANDIGNAFLSTAGKTEQSANAMAAAYAPVAAQLGSIGGKALTSGEALTVMTAAANLADAKMGSLQDTTSDLSGVMQAFNINVDQAAKVSDILYSAANITGQGIDSLSGAMEKVRARMGALAPPISQLGGLLVDMTEHGETGRVAMTALGSALTGLITPAGNLTTAQQAIQAEQQKYGVSFETASGKMKSMGTIIAEVQPIIAGMGNAQAIATLTALGFGSASSKLLDTIKAGPSAYAKAEAAVTKHGSATWAAALQAKTLGGQLKILEGWVNDEGVKLGRILIPKLELLATVTAKVVGWLAKEKVIAIALAGIITGVLGVAITAFAVQTLGKLIKNVQTAYNALMKLFGLKGGPQATQPNLNEDATTAGTTLADAIDAAGKQLILDAQAAAAALETGGTATGAAVETAADVSRDALETGGDTARDALETGGDTSRDAIETGGDTARDAIETGGDTGRDALETGGDTARDAIETGSDTGRDALETGGDAGRDALETGGDTGRDALETGGDAGRDALETGGDTARDALETGSDTGRDALETGGDTARGAMETGGDAASGSMETGAEAARTDLETGGEAAGVAEGEGGAAGILSGGKLGGAAFAAIVATQVGSFLNSELQKIPAVKNGINAFNTTANSGAKTAMNVMNQIPILGTGSHLGEDIAAGLGLGEKQAPTPGSNLGAGTLKFLESGTPAAQSAANSMGLTKADIANLAKSTDMAKVSKSSDVAKTTAAVNKSSATTTAVIKSGDAKTAKSTDVKAVETSVKAVKTAINIGKPIQVHNNQTITVTLDGQQVAKAIRVTNLNNSRAQGQNAINSGPGRGTGNA